jgi:hypothetical protein
MSWSNATILSAPPLRRNRACSHASQTYKPPFGKNLSDSVREFSVKIGTFPRKVHYIGPKSVRSSGPIGARESSRMQARVCTYASHTCPGATRQCKPQPPFSARFCPRVFSQNEHFSQKSALQRAKIHALLWAYRGPRERKDAGARQHVCPITHMQVDAYKRAHLRLTPAFRRGQRALIIFYHELTILVKVFFDNL